MQKLNGYIASTWRAPQDKCLPVWKLQTPWGEVRVGWGGVPASIDFFQRKKRNCVYTAQKHKRRYLMYIHTSFKPLQCTVSICNYMRHSYSFIFENFFLLFFYFFYFWLFRWRKKIIALPSHPQTHRVVDTWSFVFLHFCRPRQW